jgi:hypothetical protein
MRVDRDLRPLLLEKLERGLPHGFKTPTVRSQLEANPRSPQVDLHDMHALTSNVGDPGEGMLDCLCREAETSGEK